LLSELRRSGCSLEVAPDAVLERLTAGRSIGAIVGLVRLPAPRKLDRVLSAHGDRHPLLLAAVDVEDPGNVGALVRTGLASGATAFVAVGAGDPFHPRAVRTSMGSLLKLPLLRYAGLGDLLADCDRHGLMKVAAVSTGGTALPDLSFGDQGVAVLVGSEAFGLPEEVVAGMDARVTVPMAPGVDSFAVNAAAAIILYEIRRRGCRRGLCEPTDGRAIARPETE
jgi:TrmH family RNA methyltransferase